jgi:hypothetical protein
VGNERELRTEFRRALDDVVPPAPGLQTAVARALRERRAGTSVDHGSSKSLWSRLSLPRALTQLAAGAPIVVLAVAIAAVVLSQHHGPKLNAPTTESSISAYLTMIERNYARQDQARNANSLTCSTLDIICPAPGRPVVTALQRWLDDLSRFAPPAQLVVIDAQLRRHLEANIFDLNAMVAAYQARDQNGLDRAWNAGLSQRSWIDSVVLNMEDWRPTTTAAYTLSLLSLKQTLDACVSCPSLGSTSQLDCLSVQTSSCQTDVTMASSRIQALEGGLVQAAPASLSAQDIQLQQDVAQADTALLTMANAQLTNEQATFNSARLSFKQALAAIDVDIAAILTS